MAKKSRSKKKISPAKQARFLAAYRAQFASAAEDSEE